MNKILCVKPDCLHQNPNDCKFCQKCGNKLILRERFIPREILGEGGFGRTFLATDTGKPSQPTCVIKQFLPQAQGTDTIEKASRLFNQEAKQLEQLGQHPQIPELLDYFIHTEDNRQYLVQEYVEGDTLEIELQKNGVFSPARVTELLIELLNILQFVHKKQVIHRDIKPENIIRRAMDNKIFLVDFGAAKVVDPTAGGKEGTIIGSMEYCAPEQLRGKATFVSDVYSLGLTCLYLFTGSSPNKFYDTATERFLWRDKLGNRSVDEKLGKILDKMTAPIAERYQSANDVIGDLRSRPAINITNNVTLTPPIKNSPKSYKPFFTGYKSGGLRLLNSRIMVVIVVVSLSVVFLNMVEKFGASKSDLPLLRESPESSVIPESNVPRNYLRLQELLAAGNWKEADKETEQLILTVVNRQREGFINPKVIEQIPCSDLNTLNQLWLQYSDGKFGFSPQKEIYLGLGGTEDYNQDTFSSFGEKLGWKRGETWLKYDELPSVQGNLSNAAMGEMPALIFYEWWWKTIGIESQVNPWGLGLFFNRSRICQL
ncbi:MULTISPECIES: protein kinase domain-containing protein [Cylindrospermopsis]|uniref:non-specific serine/threonine protein kinase n=1 Tax=Cylindrospermopsis curvispora GIHE-G1 TaxID=2666332 RepID=A0A7H0F5T7_9CYAN|nr:GUN4 domain-containing protein [Cylindrospermopsis curvispora]QNP31403.1 GUN4 domain-containing protein [Cylindrospermopsis curvispora GIHE-G1]